MSTKAWAVKGKAGELMLGTICVNVAMATRALHRCFNAPIRNLKTSGYTVVPVSISEIVDGESEVERLRARVEAEIEKHANCMKEALWIHEDEGDPGWHYWKDVAAIHETTCNDLKQLLEDTQ